jgi:tRNA1Val (adenine37-N6)-methyltransferase
MICTDGTLLNGRIHYAQPRDGYRTGLEPVLLAATIPALPGQTVLEAGTGAGAGLLCVLTRAPGVRGIGIEADPAMAALARRNAAANGLTIQISTADVSTATAWGPVDHAFANPPWHDPAGTRPLGHRRDAAKHRGAGGLQMWIAALAAAITPLGTVSLVLPAALMGEAMALLHGAGLGRIALAPFWPRAGRAAKIVLLQGKRGRGPCRMTAGLTLHGAGSTYTDEANAILRDGAALTL